MTQTLHHTHRNALATRPRRHAPESLEPDRLLLPRVLVDGGGEEEGSEHKIHQAIDCHSTMKSNRRKLALHTSNRLLSTREIVQITSVGMELWARIHPRSM